MDLGVAGAVVGGADAGDGFVFWSREWVGGQVVGGGFGVVELGELFFGLVADELVVFEAEFVELGFVGGIIFGGAGGLADDEAAADGHAFVALPARAAQWNGASSVHNKNITCPGEKQKKELVTPGGHPWAVHSRL